MFMRETLALLHEHRVPNNRRSFTKDLKARSAGKLISNQFDFSPPFRSLSIQFNHNKLITAERALRKNISVYEKKKLSICDKS